MGISCDRVSILLSQNTFRKTKQSGFIYRVLEISPQQMWQELPTVMAHLDDPIGDEMREDCY
ncbi:hypothetical protein [Dactylococcopsis salina]|uniref:hypothetical protein n=1 Tax=Dactylococcopsis salina TaxID=292566 RepID=UPI00059E779B|nr:hypothetical protein [Dactylococcopsis salina]